MPSKMSSTPSGVSVGGLTKSPPIATRLSKWKLNKNVCIDWFTYTFPSEERVYDQILSALCLRENFEVEQSFGGRMYSKMMQLDEGTSLWLNGPKNALGIPTAKLELTGMGCRQFEARGGSWAVLFTICSLASGESGRCTRIDTVIDDFEGELSHDELYLKLYNREYTSNTFVRSFEVALNRDALTQWSVYVGSKFADAFLNIYDKKLEQIAQGKDVWVQDWMRYEMRWHHEKANSVMLQITNRYNDLNILIPELLSGFVEFKEHGLKDGDRNWYRVKPWRKWVKFLDGVSKVKVRNQKEIEQSIAKKKDWFERSVSKVLAQLYLSNPQRFSSYVGSVVFNKLEELESKDLALVNNFLDSKGKVLLDPEHLQKLRNDLTVMINQGVSLDLLDEEEKFVIDPNTGEVLTNA